ncbi:LysR family transcriptional regulator [Thermaurantiacus tibetensis]|uniref:LysR family transcriptional regulator n=1 Tax=Thermaurantiacus tibetensis TaxID=2759035 RepID=UPI00188E3F71|nr:LysR family transcriptional regulator [Thermaurantiacus tibetensis]
MSRPPDWSLYRSFLAVIETGSLSAAARALGLTQPTLARHVDALEAEIGRDLFVRTPRGLVPTDAGAALRPHAESVARAIAALHRTATAGAGDASGVVRVTASEIIAADWLPPILARLSLSHPGVRVELAVSNAAENLLEREADIAVRLFAPRQTALVAKRLPPFRLGFHAHRAYLARRGTPETLADLAAHDLIGPDRLPIDLADFVGKDAPERTAFRLATDSFAVQLAAVRAGVGIGLCLVEAVAGEPDVVPLLAATVRPELPLYIVMHEDLKTSPRCRAVFDALVEGLGPGRRPRPAPPVAPATA